MTESDYARALKADGARCNAAMRKHWSESASDIPRKVQRAIAPPQPVEIRGVVYPSMSEAARALGVSVQAIADAAANGRLDGVGLRKAARASGKAGA